MDALTRMQAFVQVVDAGGFSAAARRAGKSKALLSKYVRDLEDELGVRLLNRTTRQLSPTEVGIAYHREAVDLLQRLDDLTASVRDSHGEPRGHLRISGPRFFGDSELGGAITEFMALHPEITVDIRLDDRFVDLVEEGFDVAIRVSEPADSSLIARRLAVTVPHRRREIIEPLQDVDRFAVIGEPDLRRRQLPCRPIEQPHPEFVLEIADVFGEQRLGFPRPSRRGREAAGVDHLHEGLHARQRVHRRLTPSNDRRESYTVVRKEATRPRHEGDLRQNGTPLAPSTGKGRPRRPFTPATRH